MFRPRGLFRQVSCPESPNCELQNCLFGHDKPPADHSVSKSGQEYDPTLVINSEPDSPPPPKRRRLDSQDASENKISQSKQPRLIDPASIATQPPVNLNSEQKPKPSPAESSVVSTVKTNISSSTDPRTRPSTTPNATQVEHPHKTLAPLQSHIRPITPPATNFGKLNPQPTLPAKAVGKVEKLHPRRVQRDPVPFPSRVNCLNKLHKQIEVTNKQLSQGSSDEKPLPLTEQEIIKQALDDEEAAAIANSSSDGYKHMILSKMSFFKGMTTPQWNVWVKNEVRKEITTTQPAESVTNTKKIETGLSNPKQEVAIVRNLRSGLKAGEKFGYVLKRPSDEEIARARKALSVAGKAEICDRCGTHFQVFPGRNAEGKFTSKGPCRYHWARAPLAKHASATVYDCCGASSGSEGCTLSENHVFKVTDPARLANLWQFETSPAPVVGKKHKWPVAFDCEMCYTTKGLELVRLTAISWPEKKLLLDILVQPFGEILDLNTRFSGVSQKVYLDAPKYGTHALSPSAQSNGTTPQLERVASPLAARQLLFDLIDTDTPLIGHAIDNDLNACRVIHPFVIDTVFMYPHPRGLPARYRLKDLARKYLNRIIQNNNEAGHDSREDSEATGDLVLAKVAETWSNYKSQGWYFDGDVLMISTKKATAKV